MRKVRLLFLAMILLFTVASSVHGETEDLIIGDIVVKGLTRTDQQLNCEYRNFEEHKKYNQRRFGLSGQSHTISMRQTLKPNLAMGYALTYQNADYLEGDTLFDEKYVIAVIRADLIGDLRINLGHGFALEDGENYSYGSFDYGKNYEIAKDILVFSLKGGLATDHTPTSNF